MYRICDECTGYIPPLDVIMTQEEVCSCYRKQEREWCSMFTMMCEAELLTFNMKNYALQFYVLIRMAAQNNGALEHHYENLEQTKETKNIIKFLKNYRKQIKDFFNEKDKEYENQKNRGHE